MKKKFTRFISIFLAVMLVCALFAGCTQKTQPPAAADTSKGTQDLQSKVTEKPPEKAAVGKITDKPITLKYWCGLASDKVAPVHKSLSETALYQELENRTGIKLQFQHPPVGQETEQFNLMIASRDLPDILERGIDGYPGGPEKAISDGIVIPLNDLIDKYAPNLKKVLSSDKEYDRLAKTDKGTYYTFPFIRGHESLMVFYGPILREDFLEELGLKVPTTIDEWYNVLKTFKDKKQLDSPLTFRTGDIPNGHAFIGAYGVAKGWFMEEGKVKFGPIELGYKEFLTLFNKWYSEKLIDQDFASQDGKTLDSKVTGDKAGAFLGYVGGGMGKYLTLMEGKNSKFKLVGAPYPTLKSGEKAKFGQRDWPLNTSVSITPVNKYPKESTLFLDYGYSPEGEMLYNFGIEGKSYKLENGYPRYTEEITKNPKGIPMSLAMSNWMRSHYAGPFVQRKEYFEQFMQYPAQLKAVEQFAKSEYSRRLPRITPTPEESERMASLMSEINTYVDEMFLKFIMGQEPLDRFNDYIDKVKKMGIDDALKIQQGALERYYKR